MVNLLTWIPYKNRTEKKMVANGTEHTMGFIALGNIWSVVAIKKCS